MNARRFFPHSVKRNRKPYITPNGLIRETYYILLSLSWFISICKPPSYNKLFLFSSSSGLGPALFLKCGAKVRRFLETCKYINVKEVGNFCPHLSEYVEEYNVRALFVSAEFAELEFHNLGTISMLLHNAFGSGGDTSITYQCQLLDKRIGECHFTHYMDYDIY